MNSFLLAAVLTVLLWAAWGNALKCQTDDGVTEEDVRRIVRVCMRKIGDNTYDGSDYDNDESGEYGDDDTEDRQSRRRPKFEDDYRQRNRDHYRSAKSSFRNNGYYDEYDGNSRNGGGDRQRSHNVSLTDKQSERDRACIIHCFFQEMKMVRTEIFV